MSLDRVFLWICTATLVSGCHMFSKLTPDCHSSEEYQRAAQVAPLNVPPGLDSPNTEGALVIPAVANALPPRGPKDACLDVPPRYKAAPPNKAASELAVPAAPGAATPPESPNSPPR